MHQVGGLDGCMDGRMMCGMVRFLFCMMEDGRDEEWEWKVR